MFTRFILATVLTLISLQVMAAPYDRFECRFNDRGEESQVLFKLSGDYIVHGTSHANLTYDASIEFIGDDYNWSQTGEHSFVFSHAKSLRGEAYHGRKYSDHFKFDLTWHSVDTSIEYGVLIISRLPISTVVEGRKTTKTFTGVMDVSYNDHHGDFVWVKCTQRTYSN